MTEASAEPDEDQPYTTAGPLTVVYQQTLAGPRGSPICFIPPAEGLFETSALSGTPLQVSLDFAVTTGGFHITPASLQPSPGCEENYVRKRLSEALTVFCRAHSLTYLQVWELIGDHIVAHDLWQEGRCGELPYILCDDKLRKLFGFDKVTIYALAQLIPRHMNRWKTKTMFVWAGWEELAVGVYDPSTKAGGWDGFCVILTGNGWSTQEDRSYAAL